MSQKNGKPVNRPAPIKPPGGGTEHRGEGGRAPKIGPTRPPKK